MVIGSSWRAAAFAAVVLGAAGGGLCSSSAHAAKEPPAVRVIERNLASALAKAKAKQLLRFRRHRTKTPQAPVDEVVWVNLATGHERRLAYDASGRLTGRTSLSPKNPPLAGWNPSGACGCDLDPFTNFPGRALHVSLLADQTIDANPSFHLKFTVAGGKEPSTTDFWINRSTYLPVRSKVVYRVRSNGRDGPTMTTSDQFTWLRRTSANLAHLASG